VVARVNAAYWAEKHSTTSTPETEETLVVPVVAKPKDVVASVPSPK